MSRKWIIKAAKPFAKRLLPFSVRARARRWQLLCREMDWRSAVRRRASGLAAMASSRPRLLKSAWTRAFKPSFSAAPQPGFATIEPGAPHPAFAAIREATPPRERVAALESELTRSRIEHDALRRELRWMQAAAAKAIPFLALKDGARRVWTVAGSWSPRWVRLDAGRRAPHSPTAMTRAGIALRSRIATDSADAGTIRVSEALAARIDARNLGGWRLERCRGTAIVPPRRTERTERTDGNVSGPDRTLALADSRTFAMTADALARAGTPCAVWFSGDEPRRPYELRVELRRAALLGLSDDPAQVRRLELLEIPAALVKSMTEAARFTIIASNGGGAAGPRSSQDPSSSSSSSSSSPPFRIEPTVANPKPVPILFQVDDFLQGGLEQVVLDLGQGLAQRGFAPRLLILGRQGRAADAARSLGLPVLTLSATGAEPTGREPEREREAAYRRLLEREGIRLVMAQYSTFGAEIAAKRGSPFVQVIQNCYVWLDGRQAARFRRADRSTARTVCVSPEAACYSELALGLDAGRMTIIPNGADVRRARDRGVIEPEQRERARREMGAGPDDFVFLNVASVYGPKAQLPLVRAFAQTAGRRPRARLAMLGGELDAGYAQRVREEIARLGLSDRARMLGHRDGVSTFYAAADAFLLPSVWEGWSVALNEAIAAGLPVAATDVGSARDLLEPRSDILIPTPFSSICEVNGANCGHWIDREWHRIEPDLAEAMRQLIDRPRRRDLDPSTHRDGFERTADRMCDDYARLFSGLIGP